MIRLRANAWWIACSVAWVLLAIAEWQPPLPVGNSYMLAGFAVWSLVAWRAISRLTDRLEQRRPFGASILNIVAGIGVVMLTTGHWLPVGKNAPTSTTPVLGAIRLAALLAIWIGLIRLVAAAVDRLTRNVRSLQWRIAALLLLNVGLAAFLPSAVHIDRDRGLKSQLLDVAFIAMLLSWLISTERLLMRPLASRLAELRARMSSLAAGDLTGELTVHGRDELAHVAQTFNQMVGSLREKDVLERAFGRYVTTAVWTALKSRGGLDVATERREATVLFADVRGFTRLSESLDAGEVLKLLNVYFTRMLEVVGDAEGYVNKFIGDAVMVVFNAPLDQPDHALRATRCAERMQRALAELNTSGALRPELAIGIGVNTGGLVAGNLGSDRRAEYTVIGDTVNVASRLTSVAKPGEVIVGALTASRLSGVFLLEPLPPLEVKGKSQPLEAYRLVQPAIARSA